MKDHEHARMMLSEDSGQAVAEDVRGLADLTDFAVQFRYETLDDESGELPRASLLHQVEKLVEYVERLIHESEASG